MAGYAANDVDTKRRIDSANLTASGSYDAHQYMLRVGAGMPITSSAHVFTPPAGLHYTHLSNGSYTETSADPFNATVNSSDTDILLSMVGVKYHTSAPVGQGTLKPELRAGLIYDLISCLT